MSSGAAAIKLDLQSSFGWRFVSFPNVHNLETITSTSQQFRTLQTVKTNVNEEDDGGKSASTCSTSKKTYIMLWTVQTSEEVEVQLDFRVKGTNLGSKPQRHPDGRMKRQQGSPSRGFCSPRSKVSCYSMLLIFQTSQRKNKTKEKETRLSFHSQRFFGWCHREQRTQMFWTGPEILHMQVSLVDFVCANRSCDAASGVFLRRREATGRNSGSIPGDASPEGTKEEAPEQTDPPGSDPPPRPAPLNQSGAAREYTRARSPRRARHLGRPKHAPLVSGRLRDKNRVFFHRAHFKLH